MNKFKRYSSANIMKELGGRKNSEPDYMEFIDQHMKKFDSAKRAQALLYCVNISTIERAPAVYKKLFAYLKTFKFKNECTLKRLDSFEAFIWDFDK